MFIIKKTYLKIKNFCRLRMLKIFLSLILFMQTNGCPINTNCTHVKKCYKRVTSTISTITTSRTITTSIPTITDIEIPTITDIEIPTTTTQTSIPSTTNQPGPINTDIPITSGKTATLTYFTDTVTQCYGGDIPPGNGLAINPLLLGFTLNDWTSKYSGADPNSIPWCGKMMNVTVNGKTYMGRIIDTCNPGDDGAFVDPNTGQIIGGKCDYANVIDLYGNPGLNFLQNTVGDDFYQGSVDWVLF
jgi:hypothetical protein